MTPTTTVLQGDNRELLRTLPAESVHCVITSPPYWGLRDYGVAEQIGLERTADEHIATLVDVFREVRRLMRPDATLWLNYGDAYASGDSGSRDLERWPKQSRNDHRPTQVKSKPGLKPKDLMMLPHRLAIALQQDGWWVRSDICWAKPNPMPESVTDRPTRAHEYVFLLAKSACYYYDADAIREQWADDRQGRDGSRKDSERNRGGRVDGFTKPNGVDPSANGGRNKRSVWTIATEPVPFAHFACFPQALVEPCLLAGTSARGRCPECGSPWERVVEREFVRQPDVSETKGIKGHLGQKPMYAHAWEGVPRGSNHVQTTGWRPTCAHSHTETAPCIVLDPFAGSGTVAEVAKKHGRSSIMLELNPAYCELIHKRVGRAQPPLDLAL